MEHDLSEAIQFIRQHLAQGVSEAHIRQHFADYGWSGDWIDRAFAGVEPEPHTPARPQDVPEHYTIIRSLFDAAQAIKYNAKAYAVAWLSSYLIFIIITYIVGWLLIRLFSHDYALLALMFTGYLILFVLLFVGIEIVIYAAVGSVVVAATGRALSDGARGRQTNLAHLVGEVKQRLWHMFQVSLLSTAVTFWPIVLLFFLPLLLSTHAFLGLLIFALAFVWMLIASLRLALAQQVSFFEPDLSVIQSLRRSRYLLDKGGQWFVFKGAFWITVIYFVLHQHFTVWFWLIELMVSQAALTMLYLNRAVVRGHRR